MIFSCYYANTTQLCYQYTSMPSLHRCKMITHHVSCLLLMSYPIFSGIFSIKCKGEYVMRIISFNSCFSITVISLWFQSIHIYITSHTCQACWTFVSIYYQNYALRHTNSSMFIYYVNYPNPTYHMTCIFIHACFQ